MLTAILRNHATREVEYLHCDSVPHDIWKDCVEVKLVPRMSRRAMVFDRYSRRFASPSPDPYTTADR